MTRHILTYGTYCKDYNRQLQAKLHHVDVEDDFGILLATAYCDTPGAVTIKKDTNE